MKKSDPNYYNFSDDEILEVKEAIQNFISKDFSFFKGFDKHERLIFDITLAQGLFKTWEDLKTVIVKMILSLSFDANYAKSTASYYEDKSVNSLHIEIIKQ